jgi:hypothetical protein
MDLAPRSAGDGHDLNLLVFPVHLEAAVGLKNGEYSLTPAGSN